MPEDPDKYRFQTVWQAVDEPLGVEIIDFWRQHGALPRADIARERLPEVVILARDASDAIAGVSSVSVRAQRQLAHKFYSFRCFVAPSHRRALLAARLIRSAYEYFNERYRQGANPDVIGMIAEVENRALNREHNQAVWPHSGFVFVGYDDAHRQVRVRYFDGARITSRL